MKNIDNKQLCYVSRVSIAIDFCGSALIKQSHKQRYRPSSVESRIDTDNTLISRLLWDMTLDWLILNLDEENKTLFRWSALCKNILSLKQRHTNGCCFNAHRAIKSISSLSCKILIINKLCTFTAYIQKRVAPEIHNLTQI